MLTPSAVLSGQGFSSDLSHCLLYLCFYKATDMEQGQTDTEILGF